MLSPFALAIPHVRVRPSPLPFYPAHCLVCVDTYLASTLLFSCFLSSLARGLVASTPSPSVCLSMASLCYELQIDLDLRSHRLTCRMYRIKHTDSLVCQRVAAIPSSFCVKGSSFSRSLTRRMLLTTNLAAVPSIVLEPSVERGPFSPFVLLSSSHWRRAWCHSPLLRLLLFSSVS